MSPLTVSALSVLAFTTAAFALSDAADVRPSLGRWANVACFLAGASGGLCVLLWLVGEQIDWRAFWAVVFYVGFGAFALLVLWWVSARMLRDQREQAEIERWTQNANGWSYAPPSHVKVKKDGER